MSKKIGLFIIIVGVFACLFAIPIGAQVIIFDSYEEKSVLTYDETELVTFDDGCSYPSYYIFGDSETFTTNYDWLKDQTGKIYSDARVVELCVPTGVETGGFFKKDSTFTSLLKLNTGKTLTKTNGDFYQNQTLTHVIFGQGYTNGGLGTWFFNGAKVEYVVFDDNSAITTLPTQFFANLKTLKGLYLGRSITNIGSGTFSNMGSTNVFLMNTPNETEAPEVYYFKSSLVEGNFYNFKTNSATKIWVFPSTVNGIGSGWNIDNSSNIPKSFVFLTSDADSVVVNNTIGSDKLNTTNIYFPNISSEKAADMSVVPNTTYYFGVDAKKASYNGGWGEFAEMVNGDHLREVIRDEKLDATCTSDGVVNTYCFCGVKISEVYEENTALGHDHTKFLGLMYESYLEEGSYKYQCTRCDDIKATKADALFTCLGYSFDENGNDGISVGYNVNKAAILEYEEATGTEVSYGLFAGTKAGLGTDDVIGENGEAIDGAIAADFENSAYSFMYIKMYGFENDTQKNTLFAIGAYVEATNGEGKAYSYLQVGAPNENEKYEFIKYSDFKK